MPVDVPVIKRFKRHYLAATVSKLPTVSIDAATIDAVPWTEHFIDADCTATLPDAAELAIGDRIDFIHIAGVLTVEYNLTSWPFTPPDSIESINRYVFKVIDNGGTNIWSLSATSSGVNLEDVQALIEENKEKFIPLSGTNQVGYSLAVVNGNGTNAYSYNLADLLGPDIDATKITKIYVTTYSRHRTVAGGTIQNYIEIMYPDGEYYNVFEGSNHDGADEFAYAGGDIVEVPIDPTNPTFNIKTVAANVEAIGFELIAVGQGGLSAGSSGGSGSGTGSSSLIAYGEIIGYGDAAGPDPGGVTTTGDISSITKTDLGNGSKCDVVFSKPLHNTKYNVVYEILGKEGGTIGDSNNSHPVTLEGTKTVNGFSFVIGVDDADNTDIDVAIRIESTETVSADMTFVPIIGTNGGNALLQSVSGQVGPVADQDYTYNLSNLTGGIGYNPDRVRYVYLRADVGCGWDSGEGVNAVYGEFPDNEWRILNSVENNVAGNNVAQAREIMVMLPIKPGQTTFNLRLSLGIIDNTPDASHKVAYEIIGVGQTSVNYSTRLGLDEIINVSGRGHVGRINAGIVVDSDGGVAKAWCSRNPGPSTDWATVFNNLEFDPDVKKVVLDFSGHKDAPSGTSYSITGSITIDLEAGTVVGTASAMDQSNNNPEELYFYGTVNAAVEALAVYTNAAPTQPCRVQFNTSPFRFVELPTQNIVEDTISAKISTYK